MVVEGLGVGGGCGVIVVVCCNGIWVLVVNRFVFVGCVLLLGWWWVVVLLCCEGVVGWGIFGLILV